VTKLVGVLLLVPPLLVACGSDDGASGAHAASGGSAGASGGGGTAGEGAGGSDGGSGGGAGSDASSGLDLALRFERIKPGLEFRAVVSASEGGAGAPGLTLSLTSTRGSVGAVSDDGGGAYRATVSPDTQGSGEYVVSASAGGANVTRTAVVLGGVGDRWGQPQAFAGLVNTPAWEDSTCISPDGEWLVIEYLPVTISCLISSGDPSSPECAKARGPWTAPGRPDMPGAERIAADGTITNGCPSLSFPNAPFPVPPQALYGFHRQPDGSFAEPFVIKIDGADGCVSAFGPSLLPPAAGKSTLVFAFDDPRDSGSSDSHADLFTTELAFGTPTTLATFSQGGTQLDMNATPLGIPSAPHQGNPNVWSDGAGNVLGVLYDDESVPSADQDIWTQALTGTFPAGPWDPPEKLPPPLAEPGAQDYQPFFDGSEAFWSRGASIASSTYAGGGLTNPGAWGPANTELAPGAGKATGSVVALGEPTRATQSGRDLLSFVYVLVAPDGTLDINAGFVEAQP
jgi:hypothetical protein